MSDVTDTFSDWPIFGGGGTNEGERLARNERRRRIASEGAWIRSTYGESSREWRDWRKRHPDIAKDLLKGQWPQIYNPNARQYTAKPSRPGDIPFRAAAPPVIGGPIDAARKLPGVGRVAGVASAAGWGLFAVSFVPPSWLSAAKRASVGVLERLPNTLPSAPGMPGGSINRGKAPGYGKRPEIPRRKLPPPPPPAGANRGIARPEIPEVVVTAKRKTAPTGMVVKEYPRELRWWEKAIGLLAKVPPGQLAQLLTRSSSTAPRTSVNVGPFTLPPAREDPVPSPSPTPLTPFEGGSADCSCPPKKPRKPRKPRDECRSGRFIERTKGIQKYQTRKVPCRQFNEKLS